MSSEDIKPKLTYDEWKAKLVIVAVEQSKKDMERYVESMDAKEYYDDEQTPEDAWDEERSCW